MCNNVMLHDVKYFKECNIVKVLIVVTRYILTQVSNLTLRVLTPPPHSDKGIDS